MTLAGQPDADAAGDANARDASVRDASADGARPSRPAAVAAAVLGAVLIVALAVLTPWDPLAADPPGGPRAADPAQDFTAAEIARSQALDAALRWPAYLGLLAGVLAICALGFSPLGARLLGAVTERTGRWPLQVIAAAVGLAALLRVVGLPFDVWTQTVLREYGLSTQDWAGWSADQAKSLGVSAAVWTLALLGLHLLIRRFPLRWWAGAAVSGFLLVMAISFGYPVIVEPLFNSFRPMDRGPLRTSLLNLARADNVHVTDVLVADASRRTTTLNAYVSGFGSTRRIVVYDTLLTSTPPAQVRSIVAHELGHAKHRDVFVSTAAGALGVAVGACLLCLVLNSSRSWKRAGVTSAADPRAVALTVAVVTVFMQVSGPVQNLISRRIEYRADVHALNLTRDPRTFAAMQRSLALTNISDLRPDPLEYVLWSTHPSAAQRIALARDWARLHGVPEPRPRP